MDENADVEMIAARKNANERANRVQEELLSLWDSILKSAEERKEVARILGIDEGGLSKMQTPPIRVVPYQSNIGGAEIGLMVGTWFVGEVVLGAFKAIAIEEIKRRLKEFWEYASEKIDSRMGSQATGSPVNFPPIAPTSLEEQPRGGSEEPS